MSVLDRVSKIYKVSAQDNLLFVAANVFAALALQEIKQELDRVDSRRLLCIFKH